MCKTSPAAQRLNNAINLRINSPFGRWLSRADVFNIYLHITSHHITSLKQEWQGKFIDDRFAGQTTAFPVDEKSKKQVFWEQQVLAMLLAVSKIKQQLVNDQYETTVEFLNDYFDSAQLVASVFKSAGPCYFDRQYC